MLTNKNILLLKCTFLLSTKLKNKIQNSKLYVAWGPPRLKVRWRQVTKLLCINKVKCHKMHIKCK